MLGILPNSRRHSSGYYVTEDGKVYSAIGMTFLKPIDGRVKLKGTWYTITLLVASLYCPRPMGATRVRRKRGTSNHYSNLKWIKPRSSTPRTPYLYAGFQYPDLTALAAAINVSRMTVNRWVKKGRITRLAVLR